MTGSGAPIEVFNRYTARVEKEEVYGERWLRWTYESRSGRSILHLLVKRAWVSRWYGWRMSLPGSARRVRPFVERYGLAPEEFAGSVDSFRSFNHFFCRRLRDGARPVSADARVAVFPADGRHLGFSDVTAADWIYAKGQRLGLEALLNDPHLAQRFRGGSVVISRLCPVDYHRFHFPCSGRFSGGRLSGDALFSVSPIALRRSLDYLVANKRLVSVVDGATSGLVAMVEIGATFVGSIMHTARPGPVAKGEEKGLFRFGGSCVITVFEPGRIELAPDLLEQTKLGRELYARMGDDMGTVADHPHAR